MTNWFKKLMLNMNLFCFKSTNFKDCFAISIFQFLKTFTACKLQLLKLKNKLELSEINSILTLY